MSTEQDNVVTPLFPATEQISPEERARRIRVEGERLCGLSPGEWRLWYKKSAETFKIEPDDLKLMIEDELKAREKKKQAEAAEQRRIEKRADRQRIDEREQKREQKSIEKDAKSKAKERDKALAQISKLPTDQHEAKLIELAERLDADLVSLRDEFADYISVVELAPTLSDWDVDPWPEQVAAPALLQEVIDKIGSHVAARPHEILTLASWTLMGWVHEIAATHSPFLVLTSAEAELGKTTTLGVLRFLVPKPYVVVETTGANIYRFVDRHKPTVINDEADDIFNRRSDLKHIYNAGWTRGTKIPRQEKIGGEWVTVQFDPFSPKALGLLGLNLPRTLAGRSIVIKMWPKTPTETVEDFRHVDDDTFEQLRRKLARWSADNAAALKDAKPLMPAGFSNRIAANWRLLLAIGELAAGAWPKQARDAAERLSHVNRKPSLGMQLLGAIRDIFSKSGRKVISSKELVAALTADRDGPWCEYSHGLPISRRQVAVILAPFDVHPGVVHPTKRSNLSPSGYKVEQFAEVFARFLPADPHILTSSQRKRKQRQQKQRRK